MTHANHAGILAVRAQAPDNPRQVFAELKTAFEAFKQDHRSQLNELQKAQDEMANTVTALRVGGIGGGGPVSGGGERDRREVNAALRALIRTGDAAPLANLQGGINAGMQSASDPDGGYTVVPYLSPTMASRVVEISPMRQLARSVVIDGDTFEEIQDTGEAGAAWVGETEARPDTANPTLHKLSVPVHEVYAQPKITQRLLDDSRFDLATWLSEKGSQQFALKEGSAFIAGDGVGKPRGILGYGTSDDDDDTRAWGTLQTVPSGEASGFVTPSTSASPGDALVDLTYSLKWQYRAGASFLMNRKTAATVRKFKDADGRFLWAESLAAGEPPLLLGYPVYLDEGMPDVGAGETPIAFGDFMAGYVIVDRAGLRLLRDPFTDKPNVRFYMYKRTGAALANSEAIKLLRIGTA
jgi:HK97 family phage major capsid protein